MTEMTLVQAVNDALRTALQSDDRVILLGEDIGKNGGVFRATEGLQARFGTARGRHTTCRGWYHWDIGWFGGWRDETHSGDSIYGVYLFGLRTDCLTRGAFTDAFTQPIHCSDGHPSSIWGTHSGTGTALRVDGDILCTHAGLNCSDPVKPV